MKYFLALLLISLIPQLGNAQISITSDDFLTAFNSGGTSTSYTPTSLTGLQALVNLTGASQSWDFTTITWQKNTTQTGTPPTIETYPGDAVLATDPDFTSATHVFKVKNQSGVTIFEFLKLDATGFWILGATQDSAGVDKKLLSYSPGYQLYKFPLTYQTAWSEISNVNISGVPPGAVVTQSIEAVVDGYGTLALPGNSSQCIRLKRKESQSISVLGFGSVSTNYTFSWSTKTGYEATIETDSTLKPISQSSLTGASSSPVPSGSSYSAPAGPNSVGIAAENPLNITLSNNPVANSETRLFFTLQESGSARVSLMDAMGKEVTTIFNGRANAGQNILPIDPTTLSSGSYFIRVNADGYTAMRKLIITK
jgi:hypothetical protein